MKLGFLRISGTYIVIMFEKKNYEERAESDVSFREVGRRLFTES